VPATPPHDALLVFVRAPVEGRVKTRLAAALGPRGALRVYRRLAEHALAAARALGPAVSLRVHVTPADDVPAVRAWLGAGPAYLPQAEGDLGARMAAAFADAFAAGARRVVIIGSDLPDLSPDLLRRAFDHLSATDAVLGPAADGGYWLLGLARPLPEVFAGIAWSTDGVLAATLARLRAAGIEPARLPTLRDVDEAADLPPGWAKAAVADASLPPARERQA
jgi:rSAM/selenodomain-associated transferase 1